MAPKKAGTLKSWFGSDAGVGLDAAANCATFKRLMFTGKIVDEVDAAHAAVAKLEKMNPSGFQAGVRDF